jgi:short-subunit dehydrogenase
MNIFITGGTTGIGLELAIQYLDLGSTVGICGRDISKLPEKIKERYSTLHCYQVDVRSRENLTKAINEFVEHAGSLDIIYANAGISLGKKTDLPNFELARDIFEINTMGVLNTFEVALEKMIQQKSGHLVAVASVAGFIGLPGAFAYSASKAAVLKVCESFSLTLPKYGIHTTAIAPGFIDTPLTQKNNHPMPFIMDASKAAKKIINAVQAKKTLYLFPFSMKILIIILDKMPRFLYRWILLRRN